MFVSLNKKIIYSIITLFIFTSLVFSFAFYKVYINKIQEEQIQTIQRNQQYINVLYRNIRLNKELNLILAANPKISLSDPSIVENLSQHSEETQLKILNEERQNISNINQEYSRRYEAIQQSIRILELSSVLLILSIIMMAYLLARWILTPINRISQIAGKVAAGDLSVRIHREHQSHFTDELDQLILTFNQMLDNLQKVISEVKDKERFLQALIDSIPDGIRVIDSDYNIVVANKAYLHQVGAANQNCLKCYAGSHGRNQPCDTAYYHCPLHELLHNHHRNIRVVQQFAHFPNRHLSINAAPLRYDDAKKYIVESIRDLSDDINFSHQQKLSSLGFLSTSIAHEIKNHLGALRMVLERLLDRFYKDKPDSSEEKKHLLLIYNELLNCIDVPERLLKLTRASTDDNEIIDCNSAINDVLGLLDFEAKSKGVNIVFSPSPDELKITGNETDFKMAAINLILNAIKAMDANGILTIHINKDRNKVKISFNDTGIGISEENLTRIFEPFFTNGREDSQRGNGLGLAITKSIVEKFGGHINVTSQVGVGSCFTLSFPAIKNVAKK